MKSTKGTPLKPTGLSRNQFHARRGCCPLRKPYFSACAGSASFRYPSMARSRLAISAAQSVTTCPSTHDTMFVAGVRLERRDQPARSPVAAAARIARSRRVTRPRPHATGDDAQRRQTA